MSWVEDPSSETFRTATNATAYTVISLVALIALAAAFRSWRKPAQGSESTEFFITARRSQTAFSVCWSYFASVLGAWVIVAPAQLVAIYGWLAVISYSLSVGLPIWMIAFVGNRIHRRIPGVLSLHDFCLRRYNRLIQFYVALMMIASMGLFLLAEYVTIGSIFSDVLGESPTAIVLVVSMLTLLYSAAGGLKISMFTDQIQGVAVLLLTVVFVIYVAVQFRPTLPDLPPELAASGFGATTFVTLLLGVLSGTFFSEAMWQRAWSARDSKTLLTAAVMAQVMSTVVVAIFCIIALLAMWSGNSPIAPGSNTTIFGVFGSNPRNWAAGMAIVLGALMNESAIDSLQNAIAATILSVREDKIPVLWARIIVVLLNIPLIAAATQVPQLLVLELFLTANVITTVSFVPIAAGMWDLDKKYINSRHAGISLLAGYLSIIIFGISQTGGFGSGLGYAFYTNQYDPIVFAIAIGASAGALGLQVGVDALASTRLTGANRMMATFCEEKDSPPVVSG